MSRRAPISSRSVKPFGLESGWAELALSVPPPFVPSSLMASWLANGPPGIDCAAPSTVVTGSGRGATGWRPGRRGPPSNTRASGRSTRTMPRTRSTQKLPMVADRRRTRPRMNAIGDGKAHRGRHEVLHGQPRHLREVAHRALAGVALPVGVRREAHRGVPRERLGHRVHVGRVERERRLYALQGVERRGRHSAEREQRVGVGRPALLSVGIHAAQAVDGPFDPLNSRSPGARSSPNTPARYGPSRRVRPTATDRAQPGGAGTEPGADARGREVMSRASKSRTARGRRISRSLERITGRRCSHTAARRRRRRRRSPR